MDKELQPTDPKELKRGEYAKHLGDLRDQVDESELPLPTGKVKVIPGTEGKGRPMGADLPVYSQNEVDISEVGTKKALFNLRSLAGWRPPKK